MSEFASYLLFLLTFFGYGASTGATLSLEAVENIPIGTAARLADISSFNAEAVCILGPYQERLHSKDVFAARVNEHLAANGFAADEGHFALVLIGSGSIEVATFSRRRLDLLSTSAISPAVAQILPKGFTPENCASGDVAAVARIKFLDRNYIVLGSVH